MLKETAKGRLMGRRILAPPVSPNPQSSTLWLAQTPGKLLQILLTSGRLAQHRQ
jgi:hypothetical protein